MAEMRRRVRPPGWRFNFSAADDAARQCELTAQSLYETGGLLEVEVPKAAEAWRGRLRDVFDVETAHYHVAANTLADDLVALAAAIRSGAVAAATDWIYLDE